LARISTGKPAEAPPAKSAKAKAADNNASASTNAPRVALGRRRAKALVVIGVVLLLAFGVKAIWRQAAPIVASRDRYLIPAERITISKPPEWLVADVREQVVRASGLDKRLSVLDSHDVLVEAVKHAFALHPWVKSIDRVEKRFPPGVHVELTYREPLAVVETARGELLPVDGAGSHLPADDVPLIRRKYLPRIIGIVGQPPVGQRWEDPRLQGAVEIVASLGEHWEALHLESITPRARPVMRDELQFFVYDLVTRGGTQIIWGASPHARAPGEAKFVDKLQRLQKCVEEYGPLDSVKAPGRVDVRGELHVEPRMVKKPGPLVAQQPEEPAESETTVVK
jgi:hypothetical protein